MSNKPVFLKTEQDFSNFKKSRSLVSVNFRIRWHEPQKLTDQNFPRFGFIVPKKVMKHVTDRNLIKRRLKSIISRHLAKFKSVDILFFPKPGSIKLKFVDLEKEIVESFTKAKIYGDFKRN